jgi:hypothetical protein
VFHISNRHLELSAILARAAAESGLVAYFRADARNEADMAAMRFPTRAVALVRDPQRLGPALEQRGWSRLEPDMTRRPWTDDYSNIMEAIVDHYRRH